MEGVSMTANTPARISSTQNFSEIQEEQMVTAPVEADEKPPVEEVEVAQSVQDADEILETAKEKGFEDALMQLAEDEVGEEINEVEEEVKDTETQKSEEVSEEDGEKIAMIEQISELEKKVTDLESKNEELSERLKRSDENLQLSLETLHQMAKALKSLIEKEKDEKKKISLLEMLITVMGTLMQSIVEPEGEDTTQRQSKTEKKDDEKSSTVLMYEELMRRIGEKRQGSTSHAKAA